MYIVGKQDTIETVKTVKNVAAIPFLISRFRASAICLFAPDARRPTRNKSFRSKNKFRKSPGKRSKKCMYAENLQQKRCASEFFRGTVHSALFRRIRLIFFGLFGRWDMSRMYFLMKKVYHILNDNIERNVWTWNLHSRQLLKSMFSYVRKYISNICINFHRWNDTGVLVFLITVYFLHIFFLVRLIYFSHRLISIRTRRLSEIISKFSLLGSNVYLHEMRHVTKQVSRVHEYNLFFVILNIFRVVLFYT